MAHKCEKDEDRESIWSVSRTDRKRLAYFSVIPFFPVLIFVASQEILRTDIDPFQKLVNVIKGVGPVGISCVTFAFFILEGREIMSLLLGNAREMVQARRLKHDRKVRGEVGAKIVEQVRGHGRTSGSVSVKEVEEIVRNLTGE